MSLNPTLNGPVESKLPQKPGHYLWYILDLNYLWVGSVHILSDSDKHLTYLREKLANLKTRPGNEDFFLYQADDGTWLTMHHEAFDHKPPTADSGRPLVDGYREYNFWALTGCEEEGPVVGVPTPPLPVRHGGQPCSSDSS